GLMGYLQPAGERRLDRIGQSVSRGDFGFALMAGLGNRLAADTQLYFSRVSGSSDLLQDIVIEKGPVRMTARTAIVVPSQNDQILLALKDGFVTWQRAGDTHGVGFDTFKVTLPVAGPGRTRPKPPRDRLQRFNLDQLVPFRARDANDLTPIMARASASTRIAAAAFCVILPLFGFTFGIPPKRSRSAIGLGIGLLAIILFWRISALIEDDLAAVAPWAHGLLLSLLAALAIQLIRIQRRHGFGSIEQALLRMFTAVRRHLALVRPMRA
ncbi:MAG: LptF/LptG family permease, partial [Alphaproteobacteria bacterium]|nr:LptF/LptG family permease [Alphaproteobacteria bacterium]